MSRLGSRQRVLVTGASGFLGQVLCHHLRQRGYAVIGLARTPVHQPTNGTKLCTPQTFVAIDLANPLLAQTIAAHPVDTVFHLAGRAKNTGSLQSPIADFADNLAVTVHLLDALRQTQFRGHLLFASSAAVYGSADSIPITEETPTRPTTPYGMSKLAAENYSCFFAQAYGFSVTIVRLFSLYGPGQRKQVIYDLCQKTLDQNILDKKTLGSQAKITLWGDGSEVRDFTYVDDAAQALLRINECVKTNGKIINLCAGQSITIAELAQQVVQQLGGDIQRIVFTGQQRYGDACQ